ncbi:hypothetical protein ACFQ60_00740 [Streptomyces zhihengii]
MGLTPVIDEASGQTVYLLMSYGKAEEVSEYAAELARERGLVWFDPQAESLYPEPTAPSGAGQQSPTVAENESPGGLVNWLRGAATPAHSLLECVTRD